MDKQKLIEFSLDSIAYSQNKISIIEFLKEGCFYEVKTYWKGNESTGQEYLVKLSSFNRQSVRFVLLACRYSRGPWYVPNKLKASNAFAYSALHDLREVSFEELPLYVGWHWVSVELSQLVSGKSRMRLR